jgi:ubiquinone/menaquinone biosynthesis C-methylase UbiE
LIVERLRPALGWEIQRSTALELLDRPERAGDALAGNLDDLRRINRWLGGVGPIARGLERLALDGVSGRTVSLLDVATGAADVPAALVARAKRRGQEVRAVGLDMSPAILAHAKSRGAVVLVVGDGAKLPFADATFDVVTSSLALHHFDPREAVECLREMKRVARRGVIVNDLVRGRLGLVAAWILSRLLTRNRLTRHDAPLSVRRAYTRGELGSLAAAAGLDRIEYLDFLGSRVTMIARVDR